MGKVGSYLIYFLFNKTSTFVLNIKDYKDMMMTYKYSEDKLKSRPYAHIFILYISNLVLL